MNEVRGCGGFWGNNVLYLGSPRVTRMRDLLSLALPIALYCNDSDRFYFSSDILGRGGWNEYIMNIENTTQEDYRIILNHTTIVPYYILYRIYSYQLMLWMVKGGNALSIL